MDIVKLNKFNFLKKGVGEFGQQCKYYDCENGKLEYKVEILNNPNDVCECIIVFHYFSISKKRK